MKNVGKARIGPVAITLSLGLGLYTDCQSYGDHWGTAMLITSFGFTASALVAGVVFWAGASALTVTAVGLSAAFAADIAGRAVKRKIYGY